MLKLSISDLSVFYARRPALRSLSISPLHSGTVVGLLGPNASGKSTLIKSIAGIITPRSGEVQLSAEDSPITGKARRMLTGYVPQDLPGGAALSAFETVLVAARRLCPDDPTTRSAEILEELGLGELAQRRLNELSGGPAPNGCRRPNVCR